MSNKSPAQEMRYICKDDSDLKGIFKRADGKPDQRSVEGYASVFNAIYENDYMIETVRPGAFSRSLKEKADVRALYDHDSSKVLARSRAGTLELMQDQKGLFAQIKLPDTTYAKDLEENLNNGNMDGMSFGFTVVDQSWGMKDKKIYREILDVDLWEVSVVTFPAYKATSAQLRSMADIIEEGKAAVEKYNALELEQKEATWAALDKYLKHLLQN